MGDRGRSFSVVSLDRERVRDLYGLKVKKFREFRSEGPINEGETVYSGINEY